MHVDINPKSYLTKILTNWILFSPLQKRQVIVYLDTAELSPYSYGSVMRVKSCCYDPIHYIKMTRRVVYFSSEGIDFYVTDLALLTIR